MTSEEIGKEGYFEGLKLCFRKMEEVEYHLKYLTEQRNKNQAKWDFMGQEDIDEFCSKFLLKNITDTLKIIKMNSPELLHYHNSDTKDFKIPNMRGLRHD